VDAVLHNNLSPDCMDIKNAWMPTKVIRFGCVLSFCVALPTPYQLCLNLVVVVLLIHGLLQIRVKNMHPTEGVAIHWHGIHQKGTPYMDRPIGVTQCALGSKQSQEYVFDAYPPGAHYWHAHGSLALADGLSGPIVIHPKDPEPCKYDNDHVLFLQDWYIQTATQHLVGLLNWPCTWVGNPNSLLINSKGIAPKCLEGGANVGNTAVCLPSCQDNPATQLEVVSVEAGKTYCLRLINGGQLVMVDGKQ
jgi:L-ascorbate oxidase